MRFQVFFSRASDDKYRYFEDMVLEMQRDKEIRSCADLEVARKQRETESKERIQNSKKT